MPVDQYLGPGDGSAHDDCVYAGWEKLDPFTRYGSAVPRIWTKPLGDLVPEVRDADGKLVQRATTWGYEVIEFARDMLDLELMPWQRWLFLHMLELEYDEDDPEGLYPLLRFEKAVVLVARQNGKSTLSQVLALWFMVMAKWPVVLGTAQDLPTAEKILDGAVSLLMDDDELAPMVANVSGTNGQKSMKLDTGEEYIVKAASRASGRGLTGNLIMLDELGMQKTWASWSAITKTTQAQELSLILGLSNAGDMTSVVLMFLRLAAHRALGDPDGLINEEMSLGPQVIDIDPTFGDDGEEPMTDEEIADLLDDMEPDEGSLFLAEWSTAPDRKMRDREGWAEANPALGHRITERKIAGQVPPNEPEWTFRTEVLCQWPDATLVGPFPAGTWDKGKNKPGGPPEAPFVLPEDRMPGTLDICLDQSSDRGQTSIVVAGTRPDGTDQVVLIAKRPGTDWIRGFIENHVDRKRFRRITGQGRGAPITPYLNDLIETPIHGIEYVPWVGADLTNGCALFFDAVRDVAVRHHISPPLDMAAKTAVTKRLADGSFVWDRVASPTDIGPLMAAAGAWWLHQKKIKPPPPPPPPPRAVPHVSPSGGAPGMGDLNSMAF